MSTLTIQLPESLKKHIEALAAKEGYSVSQFLASAAGEKLAVVLTMDYLRREADAGRREDFEKYLAAVPTVAPPENDRVEWYDMSQIASTRQTEKSAWLSIPNASPLSVSRRSNDGLRLITPTPRH